MQELLDVMTQRMEVFVECSGLASSEKGLNSFAVLLFQKEEAGDFVEFARTETICNSTSPQYCNSFEFEYDVHTSTNCTIRVDLYSRKTVTSERLHDHELIGKTTVPLENLLIADGGHLATQLSHPSKPEKTGVLVLHVEEIDESNTDNSSEIQFEVSAAVLRKRDWNKPLLGQRYELSRAHKHDDSDGHTIWLPIYKSNRITKQRDSNSILEFSSASLKYRHACNGDDERRMRIKVFATPCGVKKHPPEIFIGMVDFTFRDICEIDPTEEELQIERNSTDLDDLGNVSILRAEPTDFGSHFSLQFNYESTSKYISAVSSDKGGALPKRKVRAVARRISKNIHSRGHSLRAAEDFKTPAITSSLFTSPSE